MSDIKQASFQLVNGSIQYQGSNKDVNTLFYRFTSNVELKLLKEQNEVQNINFPIGFVFYKKEGETEVSWSISSDLEYYGLNDSVPFLFTISTVNKLAHETDELIRMFMNDEVERHLAEQLLEQVKGVL